MLLRIQTTSHELQTTHKLPDQDSNLEYGHQKPMCYQLHHRVTEKLKIKDKKLKLKFLFLHFNLLFSNCHGSHSARPGSVGGLNQPRRDTVDPRNN